jgi:hypothetical protein
VEIDEPREHEPGAGVDDLLARPRREPVAELEYPVGVQSDVTLDVKTLARVDDRAAADQHLCAQSRRSSAGLAGVIAGR